MSLDRYVKFRRDRAPSLDETERVVRDFFGDGAEVSDTERFDDGDRIVVRLPGNCSSPFRDIEEGLDLYAKRTHERGLVVSYDADVPYLVVRTRLQDEYTDGVAQRLVEIFARFWEGEYEPPS